MIAKPQIKFINNASQFLLIIDMEKQLMKTVSQQAKLNIMKYLLLILKTQVNSTDVFQLVLNPIRTEKQQQLLQEVLLY
jgi:hypothetical protein